MSKLLPTTAAALLAATVSVGAYGQQSDRSSQMNGTSGDAAQQIEQVKQQRQQEASAQGDRKIEVREKAAYGLGELPPDLMTKAIMDIAADPKSATVSVLQAANLLEIVAAVDADAPESKALVEQSKALRDTARQIEFRQLLSPDGLKRPFAKAALAGADYYRASAAKGLEQNDEETVGYSLKGAGQYLAVAHVFAEKEPSAQVALASYNAEVLADQIINASKPTTRTRSPGAATRSAVARRRPRPASRTWGASRAAGTRRTSPTGRRRPCRT